MPPKQQTATIRKLKADDASEYQALRLRALREHPEAFSSSWEREREIPLTAIAKQLRESAASPDHFILGAHAGDRLAGMVGLFREQGDKQRHKGVIWGMYVAPEARGMGVGRMLLREAVRLANEMDGLEQIKLGVVTSNAEARTLYASMGFESYGLEKNSLYVNGEYYDEEFMVLWLE